MSDLKISAAPSAAPALATDSFPIARVGDATKRALTLADALALGSRSQLIVNGRFRLARFSSSQALTVAAAYGSLDRWWAMQFTAAAGTFGQVVATVPGFSRAAKLQRNAGSGNLGVIQCGTCFETLDCVDFQGKTVTLSAWLRKGANFSDAASSVTLCVDYGTGTDQSSVLQSQGIWTGHVQNNQAKVITALDALYSWTVAIPNNATQIGVRFFYTPTGVAGADDSVTIHGPRLDEGPARSAFEFIPKALDLRESMRWMWKTFVEAQALVQNSGTLAGAIGYIVRNGGGALYDSVPVSFPVPMRAIPTSLLFYNPNAANAKFRNTNLAADSSTSAVVANFVSENGFMCQNQQVAGDLASHTLAIHAAAFAGL